MSTTERVAVAQHTAVQRVGARPGSIHAAVWIMDAQPADAAAGTVPAGHWRTACGEDLRDGPRGRIVPLETDRAMLAPIATICRRCARVGDSVSS